MKSDKEILNINDICEILDVKKNFALRIVHSNIPFFRVGRRIRVRRKDLEEYIESNITEAENR